MISFKSKPIFASLVLAIGILTASCNGDSTLPETNTPPADDAGGGDSVPSRADVVFALDTSGSMTDEVVFVQNQLNDFAAAIAGAGIDLNVVVIENSGGFCVPPPLGSGTCPNDENLPGYRHVLQTVGSTNAFDKIVQFHPDWSLSLRAGSRRAIVVVSDDDSATSWQSFEMNLLSLDPSLAGYRFHAIVASVGPIGGPPLFTTKCTGLAADPGTEYIDLANNTGGIWADLCDQDFTPPFTDMAAAVVADFP